MVGRDNKFLDSLCKSEVDSFLMFANCDPPPKALDASSSRSEGSSTLQCHGGILGESDLSWFAECDECVAVLVMWHHLRLVRPQTHVVNLRLAHSQTQTRTSAKDPLSQRLGTAG